MKLASGIKNIAQAVYNGDVRKGKVHSIDFDVISVVMENSTTVIRNVEVVGNPEKLSPGDTVTIVMVKRKAIALTSDAAQLMSEIAPHLETHGIEGSDPVTPELIGAASLDHTHEGPPVDGVFDLPSLRSLGIGSQQAAPGDHGHSTLTMSGQLTSTVAVGTAPFVVASSTVVGNLNADKVDGYHAGNTAGSIPINNGTVNATLNADKVDGLDGTQFVRNDLQGQTVQALFAVARQDAAYEGGEIGLQKPITTTLAGDIAIDSFSNSLRIFENGGTVRGVQIDFTKCPGGINSRILHDEIVKGTVFPTGPFVGQQFFRTDLGFFCYWNGTYWLTTHEYSIFPPTVNGISASLIFPTFALRQDLRPYFTRVAANLFVATTNNATNYWRLHTRTFVQNNSAGDYFSTLSTFSDAAGVFLAKADTPNRVSTSNPAARVDWYYEKTGSPGIASAEVVVYYRLVIP